MITKGIPESDLFFYYDSLAIENGTVQKNEVVVSARDLRGAILEKLQRYGVGPGRIDSIPATLSAVLYAMEQGKWARAQHDSLTLSCLYTKCVSLNFGFFKFRLFISIFLLFCDYFVTCSLRSYL
jgi:hypothetical protein